jgi:hypothetical protein
MQDKDEAVLCSIKAKAKAGIIHNRLEDRDYR